MLSAKQQSMDPNVNNLPRRQLKLYTHHVTAPTTLAQVILRPKLAKTKQNFRGLKLNLMSGEFLEKPLKLSSNTFRMISQRYRIGNFKNSILLFKISEKPLRKRTLSSQRWKRSSNGN